ncbi:MAG: DotU family type IV/VI secretion system protein [Desulfobacteraceae bacterium]|nr:MAG: DotU family type IV/VI secretion system protein [Desulfobacteraceae bacterium]
MRIVDCFIELLAYVAYFLKTLKTRQAGFDQVRANIERLVSRADACLQDKGIPKEDCDHARFAIFAWIDEVILSSPWNEKDQWQRQQLQRVYFQTADAGEVFFERLNLLGPHQNSVREVYYLCLAMGFTGRYIHEGDDFLLDQLRTSNLKVLMGSSIGLPALDKGPLFSEAYPQQTDQLKPQRRKRGLSPVTLLGIAFPVVLYAALFLIYRFILSNIAENLLNAVP